MRSGLAGGLSVTESEASAIQKESAAGIDEIKKLEGEHGARKG